MSEDDYVFTQHLGIETRRVKIPEDSIKCPDCDGSSRTRFRYSEPSPMNNPIASDFMSCILCMGKGFVEISYLEKYHPDRLPKKKKVSE